MIIRPWNSREYPPFSIPHFEFPDVSSEAPSDPEDREEWLRNLPPEEETSEGDYYPEDNMSFNDEGFEFARDNPPKQFLLSKSRPLLKRGAIANFLSGKFSQLPKMDNYEKRIYDLTRIHLVGVRVCLEVNNSLWRLHSFLRKAHKTLAVNRQSKRLFYRLTQINLSTLSLNDGRTRNISFMHSMHKNTRIFAF